MPTCNVCHNRCNLTEGQTGLCHARKYENGFFVCKNYGLITSIALDPIEKKPLNLFYPGSNIISVGSYGCNLRCPFCQNHEISIGFGVEYQGSISYLSPDRLAEIADSYRDQGNIGVAFTYNEPLMSYEYVIDVSRKVHEKGLKTVLVSNGCVSMQVAEQVLPHIDAMNIDLKGFTDDFYRDVLHGDRKMVMDFIEYATTSSHVEITTLVIPGLNDRDEEIAALAKWIASLNGGSGKSEIALHISRFFPRFKMQTIPATCIDAIYHLRDVAEIYLDHVYTGNC